MRESWLVEDRWWTERPLRRRYWEVVTEGGRNLVSSASSRAGAGTRSVVADVRGSCMRIRRTFVLDGASLPDELAAAAVRLGYDALALTDHNSLSGSMEFAQAAAALGLRAIHGAEIDLEDRRHVTLLVGDATGWRNLCRIVTRAHAHDRDHGEPEPAVPLETLEAHAEGLVCLSGCALHGVHDEPTLRRLLAAFGRDRLRVELQRPFLRDDRARNRRLAGLAERLGVPVVATGDPHAHARSRAPLQDAFVALRTHTTLDASEPLRRGNSSHVLASPEAMTARFADDHARAVVETRALADRLEFDLTHDLGYRYPGSEDPTANRTLAELCAARFDERYPPGHAHREGACARLEEELKVIDSLGLPGFFLLHHDMLELAREVAVEVRGPDSARALLPPGRGRGSSVSSIVCYLTGLSHDRPDRQRALPRALPQRGADRAPDIDLDFPRDVREVLIPRVHDRYGRERSALVAAFPTFRARGAIRELGKVLGLPPGELERVARGAEPWSAHQVERDIADGLGEQKGGRWRWLARLCDEAYGLPRHLSQHSGGMIVSTRSLVDCCPVLPAAMEGRQLCQWDKDSCADAGFLKIDLLGLGMLSAVERCVEEIARVRGERIDLSRIPFDDQETYTAIQEAETMGVFQIESRAQMQSLRRTRPESLDDLTIQVAIVRPGPILGGAVHPYIERRQRLRVDRTTRCPTSIPRSSRCCADTLGAIVFQDQVIEVAMAFAGFSPGEAEGLRRAMSRKRSAEAIEAHHGRFVEGAARTHGVERAAAERVYDMIVGFSGFGFPKAHAAAFGLLAYQSTWLRVHYGPEFLCALLNEQPMGFYPGRAGARRAAPRHGGAPPTHQRQRHGVLRVENMARSGCAEASATSRGAKDEVWPRSWANADAPWFLLDAGVARGRGRASVVAIPRAAEPGACARTTRRRRESLWQLGVATPGRTVPGGVQLSLPLEAPQAPALKELTAWERLLADFALRPPELRLSHPMALRGRTPAATGVASSRDLRALPTAARVSLAGLVVARQRPVIRFPKGIVIRAHKGRR